MNKILIIQTAFIGDVILATAAVDKLASYYPSARIDFLLRKGNESLLQNNPAITRVYVWDKKKSKNRNLLKIVRNIRKENYDLVINLQRFFSSGLVTVFSAGKQTIGYDKNPISLFFTSRKKHIIESFGGKEHEVQRNQSLIEEFTDEFASRPRLYPSKYDFENVLSYKSTPYICIAPASVWFTKQFPKEKWIELINSIPEKFNVYLLGGGGDKLLCNQIISEVKRSGVMELCGKFSFLESAALMKDAVMNYVNDSAPLHIASAMNAKVCAIFCSTVLSFGFGPLSENSVVMETQETLACRPCGLHGYKKCPKGHFKCGYSIEIMRLLQLLPTNP